jgi:protein-S-isoprenylcysteine O-methyltransferase Ste14
VNEHEADTRLSENDRTWQTVLKRGLRTTWWLVLGAVAVGYVLLVPLATILLGVSALSRATVGESLLVGGGLLVAAVAYWSLVWWVEANGIARWKTDGTDGGDVRRAPVAGWED